MNNPIRDIWHVMIFRGEDWHGYYQFFHPNEAAARKEEERINSDPEMQAMGIRAESFRYALDGVWREVFEAEVRRSARAEDALRAILRDVDAALADDPHDQIAQQHKALIATALDGQ